MVYRKNERPLTAILKAEGNAKLPDAGQRRKEVLARKVWDLAITGKVEFDDETEKTGKRVLKASVRDWKDTIQWIYSHVDGPARVDAAQSDGLAGSLSATPADELQAIIDQTRDIVGTAAATADASD